MTSLTGEPRAAARRFAILFGCIVVCWLAVMFVQLYFFGYAAVDSWCYAAPADLAKAPFQLTMPFLGAFEGANKAWGLHWPGGLLLSSVVTPYLPHGPATYVAIPIVYWLLASAATAVLVRRYTGSRWLALYAFLLVACDRLCSSIAWFERYEMLGAAIAIAGILALCGQEDGRSRARYATIGVAFFILPLIHPVFSGLGLGLLLTLALRTIALKQRWTRLSAAAGGYAAGWAVFIGYFWSRPWLYAQFRNHADQNLEITREASPPGFRTFLVHLYETDRPTRAGAVIYLVAFCTVAALVCGLWKCRREWKEYLAREDLAVFVSLALGGTLVLSQMTYNTFYWATAWPFAAALACLAMHRVWQRYPKRMGLIGGVAAALMLMHMSYWPARTYLWYKTGWVNMRSELREFAQSLPRARRLFIPEVLWDTYPDGNGEVYMNSLPFSAGAPMQQRYASYIVPLIRPGDVLVVDVLQSHPCLIGPPAAGWKEIRHRKVVYMGADHPHGFDLTAYQKL